MKTAIEYFLFRSDVSNYQISKVTGIGQNVLGNYTTGKSDVGNMSLDNAIKLHDQFKALFEKMEKECGYVEFEGKDLALTQLAYVDSDFSPGYERTVYKAHAIDKEGNEYRVMWLPVEGFEEMTDESDCCNWDEPFLVEEI